jgi:putative transposase
MQKVIPLEPGGYFHIYDRGVNGENLFREERNYVYFLNLYVRHITPVAETFAYCLLRNHFHLLVRIRTQTDAVSETASVSVSETPSVSVTPTLASKAINNFLTAYAKAVNKSYDRTGALFQHHFGRIPVTSSRYFAALVRYIHYNPCKHGFVADFREWPHSSYHTLLSDEPTQLARATVLDWFGGAGGMRKLHASGKEEPGLGRLQGNDAD